MPRLELRRGRDLMPAESGLAVAFSVPRGRLSRLSWTASGGPSPQSFDSDSRFSQPLFRAVDFEKLERKEVKPPWRPDLKGPTDLSYMPNARAADEEPEQAPSGAGMANSSLKEVGRLDAEFSHL